MKKLLLVAFLALALAATAFGDVNRPHQAVQEAIAPHGDGGATGFCSIIYYNLCAGWLWTWSGWAPGDEVGVYFDLPADCGKLAGECCENLGSWWYWRYTLPTYGYEVHVDLWELDASFCKTSYVGGSATIDPIERWNNFGGLGTVSSDYCGLMMTWVLGTLPRFASTNNVANIAAPNPCAGFVVPTIPGHTFYWGGAVTQYCPPQYLADGLGPSEGFIDASFDCQTGIATEPASWGEVKGLFR
ncbi:MAG: hypothetical protein JW958_07905 [Candidatus Eisenbacteria bacterium]|nr:hypothetical protein [Candidatus Eisenbacteria bacterium]